VEAVKSPLFERDKNMMSADFDKDKEKLLNDYEEALRSIVNLERIVNDPTYKVAKTIAKDALRQDGPCNHVWHKAKAEEDGKFKSIILDECPACEEKL